MDRGVVVTRRVRIPILLALLALIASATVISVRGGGSGGRGQDVRQSSPLTGKSTEPSSAPRLAATVVNGVGVVSAERYATPSARSTMDNPYGPFGGGGTVAAYAERVDLVRKAGAAVVVEVLSIAPPRLNSDDGGLWIPGNGEALAVVQDVRLRVLDRWGDKLSLPQEFDLSVAGGQVQVTVTAEQAKALEIPQQAGSDGGAPLPGVRPAPGPSKGGTFLFSMTPSLELRTGERSLLFVQRGQLGWQGGGRVGLYVVGESQGKFVVQGDRVQSAERPTWSVAAESLKQEVQRDLGTAAG